MRLRNLVLGGLLLVSSVAFAANEDLTRLLRFPDIQGDTITFVYAGDIWVVSSNGGVARRLTSDRGMELFPKLSPDGRWIAFSGEYSGSRQVYVISTDGGQPRQLTWYNDVGPMPPRGGWDYEVLDWTPDGKNVLVRANRLPWGQRMGRPYLVPVEGGMETPLAIPESGGGMLSPDGTKMVYTPIEREFRTWKRYHGGRAQDVWIYDLVKNTSEQITDYDGTDNQPMWVGDTIYFTSDRDGGVLNIFAWDPSTRNVRRVTDHKEWDVLWPAAGSDAIVYENGGWIYRLDPATGKSERVPIRVFGDFRQTLPHFENVKGSIESGSISPTGVRAAFGARGEVFTVPAKEGETRNLTSTPGIRERDVAWSPDGRWIAWLSDRTGEYELYVRSHDAGTAERKITSGAHVWYYAPVWSPDSSKIAVGDKDRRLHWVDVVTGKITDVDQGTYDGITTYRWSPDSQWIAYTKNGDNSLSSIWLYSLKDGQTVQLTDGRTDDRDPVFDPKGRYLYFLSNRDYNLTFSDFEFNYLYTNPTRAYVGILSKDGPALFLPQNDEEKPKTAGKAEEKKDAKAGQKDEAAKIPVVRIDVDGFENRVRAIPGDPADYRSLAANAKGVFYLVGSGMDAKLKFYNLDDKKEEVVLEGVGDYELSANGEKVLFRKGQDYGIADAKPGQKAADSMLALGGLEMKVDPKAEWEEMFVDGWRILRDWFYDPGMHGTDWQKMREKYAALVPYIATRSDLDYIFGELGGEISSGHVYVNAGDQPKVERVDNGLLGAEIVADPSGYFRIAHIFPGENWHEQFRSPLTEPGVSVHEGDFIIAVDGHSAREVKNFYQLLENKANKVVTLLVNDQPSATGAHQELVRPVGREGNLRYLDWVKSRIDYVDKASGGRIGYIHIPNTSFDGNRELFKYFYPQVNKEALIIDDRYNGGGFIPDRMIELLDRPVLNYWVRRGIPPQSTPLYSHVGPKAALINGYASSGGDAFPYYFRKRGLGKLIGTRTWGGLIGLSGNPDLMDGGSISVPTFRFLDTGGAWAVENVGVAPDIEVVDRPELVAKGQDPTLEKAVEVLLEELKGNPPVKVTVPPIPAQKR